MQILFLAEVHQYHNNIQGYGENIKIQTNIIRRIVRITCTYIGGSKLSEICFERRNWKNKNKIKT